MPVTRFGLAAVLLALATIPVGASMGREGHGARECDDADVHYNLGIALHEKGKLEEAADAYREAIRIRPNFHQAHLNLGTVLQDQGKPAEAVAAYREAIRLVPEFALAYSNMGGALSRQGSTPRPSPLAGRPSGSTPNLPRRTTTWRTSSWP